ncbi:MAG: universal stress protein [Desulfobacterales bacterium]|nr:MAG: universal stress protein [Desulfobacterales bacterium]
MNFTNLFSILRIGSVELKNRLVALPVFTGYAYPDGRASPSLIEHYTQLAGTGVGMVVVANAAVAPDGVTSTYNLRADYDDYIPGLARLANAIQQQGARACLQLNHAGRFAKTDQPLLPAPVDGTNLAFNIAALREFMQFFPLEKRFQLTRYFLKQANAWRRPMSAESRDRIINDFADAAARAYQAGFDLIELHGANGYLLCQFLSSFTNKTPSDFGGDFAHRTKFPLAVIRAVKTRLPATFPMGFRLIVREWVPEGIALAEAIAFAEILQAEGIAYLSASAGSFNSIFFPEVLKKMSPPAYLQKDIAKLTRKVRIPTIISGRIITPSLADRLIRKNVADLIGLGRPLRADIHWLKKAADPGRKIKTCSNCNWCLKQVVLEEGFNCRQWPKLIQQRAVLDHQLLRRNYKILCVVADPGDLQRFEGSLPHCIPNLRGFPTPVALTVLFLDAGRQDKLLEKERDSFLTRCRNMLDRRGLTNATLDYEIGSAQESLEKEVQNAIRRGNYGVVLMGHKRRQAWQERLLYRERRKVIGLVGPGGGSNDVLVPVDLSDTTLLILTFLRNTYLGTPGMRVNAVHILTGPSSPAQHRWKALKKICGVEDDLPLHLFPSKGDTASEILAIVEATNCSAVIMGKRGISGIKRWLLGSVSARVLDGLTEQSLFLVD